MSNRTCPLKAWGLRLKGDRPGSPTLNQPLLTSQAVQEDSAESIPTQTPHTPRRTHPYSQKASTSTAVSERTAAPLTDYQQSILWALNTPTNEDEHFLLSLLPAFQRLDNITRSKVRMGFQKLLHEAEFGES